jgi:hypothetical protein
MITAEAVQQAIKQLPPSELLKFRCWYAQFDADAWDMQIETDAIAGKLDALVAEALAEYKERSINRYKNNSAIS